MNQNCVLALAPVVPPHGWLAAQACAWCLAVLPIAGLVVYGWFRGVFRATVAGTQIVVSFVLAFGLAPALAAIIRGCGCPVDFSLAIAFMLLFCGCLFATTIAVGLAVPDGAVRLSRLPDCAGGAVIGGMAGMLLAGVLLVGWSVAGVPGPLRFSPDRLPVDGGRWLLDVVTRWVTPSGASSRSLLHGDPTFSVADSMRHDASTARGSPRQFLRASEPFVDMNGNGTYDGPDTASPADTGECFLDCNDDGTFTHDLRFLDQDANNKRTIGILDCYRLGSWHRVRCQHVPRIVSSSTTTVEEKSPVGHAFFIPAVDDPDAEDDVLTFSLIDQDAKKFVDMDPHTGQVTLRQELDYDEVREFSFTFEVQDQTNNGDQQTVTVRVQDKLMR